MKTEISHLIVAMTLTGFVVYPWSGGGMSLDPRLVPVAMAFGGLWTVRRLCVFWKAWSKWHSWRLPATWRLDARDLPIESSRRWMPRPYVKDFYSCLPRKVARLLYPDKGILLGRAFRWSPEYTQELETHLLGGKSLPVGVDMRGGYPALHAVGMKEERPLVLPWSELVGHVLIGGTTRSGKTRLLEVILSEAIRGPGTVIVIDPKGDSELLVRAAVEAKRAGRKFAFFSPAHARSVVEFQSVRDVHEHNGAGGAGTGADAGWRRDGEGRSVLHGIPAGGDREDRRGAAGRWAALDHRGLNAATTLVPPFQNLLARYLQKKVLGREDKTLKELDELIQEYRSQGPEKADLLADALIDDHEKPRDHFVQVTANLVPAFRGVTGEKMDRLLSSTDPDLTWKSVVEERKVVYFAMSSLLYGEVANRIGRVILQDLIGFLGERYAFDNPETMTPLTILIDEFSNVAYPGFIDALNKGGGARANIMLAMQSLADPEATMGKDGTQRVLDNLNTRIWFRLTDDATAKVAVEGLGMTTVSREDISHSLSFGGSSGTSGGSRGAMQYVDRSLVRPEWVTGLPRGEAFVRTRGENWKLRVPLLKPVGKKEVAKAAAAYGLVGVLAELKEQVVPVKKEGTDVGMEVQSATASYGASDLLGGLHNSETDGEETGAQADGNPSTASFDEADFLAGLERSGVGEENAEATGEGVEDGSGVLSNG